MEESNVFIFSAERVFKEILKRVFSNGGQFTIKDYCSYQDALNLKNFEKVGIIVVDDVVIGMSSYELVVFLRYNMKLTCPIIFFGTSMHKGKRKAIQSGASYFFEKPFNPVELLDYVKELRI